MAWRGAEEQTDEEGGQGRSEKKYTNRSVAKGLTTLCTSSFPV